jgi:hypothetical protein
MHITMASLHKPKSHDAPDRKHGPEEIPADATAETPDATDDAVVAQQPAPAAKPAPAARPTPEPVQAPTSAPAAVGKKSESAPAREPVQAGE